MRNTHTIKPVRGSDLPVLFCCLDTEMAYGPNSESDSLVSLQAVRVATRYIRYDRGGRPQVSQEVSSPESFKAGLHQACRRGASLWLVGRDLYEQLVALRFFDDVGDRKKWSLQEDSAGDQGELNKLRKRRPGFCVLEPGLTILVVNRPDGGTLHCVDVANYGAGDLPGLRDDSQVNALAISQWVMAWRKWLVDNDAGKWRYTIGSQASYAYRKKYLRGPVVVHGHDKVLQLESDSLFGGRCELFCFGKVKGPVYHLDARSLYGAVAEGAKVPCALAGWSDSDDFRPPPGDFSVIADVSIRVGEPCVPMRSAKRGITIWPVGRFRTVICGPELELVKDQVDEIYRVAWYHPAPIFNQWARDAWELRLAAESAGNGTIAKQVKLWGQLLYGKFAQRFRGWEHDPNEPTTRPWALWTSWDGDKQTAVPWRSIAGRVERHVAEGLVDNACPAITAWINSLARVWLWKAILAAGRENVYYCDTDSLFCNSFGFKSLLAGDFRLGEGLGDLRLEGVYQEVDFRGVKNYVADGRVVCAGLDRRQRAYDRVEPVTTACHKGRAPISIQRSSVGAWRKEYQHGKVLPDGSIEPWTLDGRDEK